MTQDDLKDIKNLLQSPKNIVIIPHKNPDGDALGSTLALQYYLELYNHKAHVIAPNDYPEFLKWLPNESEILKYDMDSELCDSLITNADIIFTLDFNALSRTGDVEVVLTESSAIKIMIDHHQQPENYAKYVYSDVCMSSTCEMVYHFIDKLGDKDKINKNLATCLYTGIMTDTGSFRFPSTSSDTLRVAAFLMDCGADHSQIHNQIYDTNSFERMQLLGQALTNLNVISDLRTAYISLSQQELNKYQYKKGDTEGFVNYALSLSNIIFAAIFIEDKQQEIIKISLRSKGDFSVNEFARKYFDGGGHNNAAGGKSDLSLQATIDKFISILPDYYKALNYE